MSDNSLSWETTKAALIRAFWTFIFPSVGYGVNLAINYIEGVDLTYMPVGRAVLVAAIAAALYGVKKKYWPDTEW